MKWFRILPVLLMILTACAAQREQIDSKSEINRQSITTVARQWWGSQNDTVKIYQSVHDTLKLTSLQIHTNTIDGRVVVHDTVFSTITVEVHDTIFQDRNIVDTSSEGLIKVGFWLLFEVSIAFLVLIYVVVRCR